MDRTTTKTLLLSSLALLFLLILSPLAGAESIYSSVVRIHVLANSDSPEDQALKLSVRDRLLEYANANFSLCENREEAEEEIRTHLSKLEEVAQKTLLENHSDQNVLVSLTKEYYPTRYYEDFSLPAGEYTSLQVRLGEAEGKNWWCVLFPPICVNSAKGTEDALLDAGMGETQVKTVTVNQGEYRIRFKLVEWFQTAKHKAKSWQSQWR